MTRDEMTQLAKDAGIFDLYGQRSTMLLSEKEVKRFQDFLEALEKFAVLVAAAEREACAKLCHNYGRKAFNNSSQNAAMELRDAIRAKGQE